MHKFFFLFNFMREEVARNLVSLIVELPRKPFPGAYTKFYHVYEIFSTINSGRSAVLNDYWICKQTKEAQI